MGKFGEVESLIPCNSTPAMLPPSPPSTEIDESCVFPSHADIICDPGHQWKASVKTISWASEVLASKRQNTVWLLQRLHVYADNLQCFGAEGRGSRAQATDRTGTKQPRSHLEGRGYFLKMASSWQSSIPSEMCAFSRTLKPAA